MRQTAIRMMKVARVGAAIASAMMPSGGTVRAQAEREFLRPAQAAKILADSRPWTATRSDGHGGKMTFNPDGTGTFDGPMSLSTTWTIKGEDICFAMSIVGVVCHRYARVAGGLDGYIDGAVDLRLRR